MMLVLLQNQVHDEQKAKIYGKIEYFLPLQIKVRRKTQPFILIHETLTNLFCEQFSPFFARRGVK